KPRGPCGRMCASMRFALASILLVACGCGGSPAAVEAPTSPGPKAYAIHLSHPSKVGDRTHLVLDEEGRTTGSHLDVQELVVDGRTLLHGAVDITNAAKADDAIFFVDGTTTEK